MAILVLCLLNRGMSIGLEEVDRYVSGLHQSQILLLVQTAAGRADAARRILAEAGGRRE